MRRFGICMEGCEERFEEIAEQQAIIFGGSTQGVTYVEIGVAGGRTLGAVASILNENAVKWRAIGIDLPVPVGTAGGLDAVTKSVAPIQVSRDSSGNAAWGRVTYAEAESTSYLVNSWDGGIHLALIDGCHGVPCVKADFNSLQHHIVPGGVVLFHDFDKGWHTTQKHCGDNVGPRRAAEELGLIRGACDGWLFTSIIQADREKGGNSIGVFEKQL